MIPVYAVKNQIMVKLIGIVFMFCIKYIAPLFINLGYFYNIHILPKLQLLLPL